MRLILAIFFPFLAFFTIGRPISGIVCLLLQLTIFGWIPASLWAIYGLGQHKAYKGIEINKIKPSSKIIIDIEPFPRGEDFLGKAADAKHKALQAIKDGEHDKAWGLLQDLKTSYFQHAVDCKFTERERLALESSVDEHSANILRLEGKHEGAFLAVMYWIALSNKITKTQEKKLSAYFNRLKLKNTQIEQVHKFIKSVQGKCDYQDIEVQVQKWINLG